MSSPRPGKSYPPIENYGVIGDLRTVALVGPGARIDQLCWPQFDSPSVFAGHIDREDGGHFAIEPLLRGAREKKLYFPGTNVLLSRCLSEDGIAEVSDFMYLAPGDDKRQALVRRAKAVHGRIRFRLRCAPRFDYARSGHHVEERDGALIFEENKDGGLALRLRGTAPLEADGPDGLATFELDHDETALFILDSPDEAEGPGLPLDSQAFKTTADYWHRWLAGCQYKGRWQEMVHRSALALKLLVSRDYGSVVAAPTFGFPNDPGGERNWDYRRAWLRDAAFTIYAFMRLGYTEEAKGFMDWLKDRIGELGEGDELQAIYRIDGTPIRGEIQLDHLEGYEGSLPIRIGSTNYERLQLDIYGELMDSVYLYDKYGEATSYDLWKGLGKLVDYVTANWRRPDSSIWEVRAGEYEFLFSRVMCWVAMDRAIRLAQKRSLPAPIEDWRKTRDSIYHSVFEDFWSEKKGAFTQFKGSDALDAAALIMPLVRFISPTDPRWLSAMEAIERELAEDSLVYRYRVNEAFPEKLEGKDGTFSICSFWLIECVGRSGDLRKARYLMEKMLSYANPLGLFAEQIGSRGEALGNLPQAFTHLALISAAYDLDRRLNQAGPEVGGGGGG